MQVLMSEAAHARVASELAAIGGGLEIVTLAADGALSLRGEPLEEADPEVFWLSLDMYEGGLLPGAFQRILKGTAADGCRCSTPASTIPPSGW